MDSTEVFKELEGRWHISRTITSGGKFKGGGVFTAMGNAEYFYTETGSMALDTGEIHYVDCGFNVVGMANAEKLKEFG